MALTMVALAVFFYIKDNSEVTCPLAGDNVRKKGNSTNADFFLHGNWELAEHIFCRSTFFIPQNGMCDLCSESHNLCTYSDKNFGSPQPSLSPSPVRVEPSEAFSFGTEQSLF